MFRCLADSPFPAPAPLPRQKEPRSGPAPGAPGHAQQERPHGDDGRVVAGYRSVSPEHRPCAQQQRTGDRHARRHQGTQEPPDAHQCQRAARDVQKDEPAIRVSGELPHRSPQRQEERVVHGKQVRPDLLEIAEFVGLDRTTARDRQAGDGHKKKGNQKRL